MTREETDSQDKSGGIRFDDRVAIVTGAGAGLGRVYALELAKRGAKVVVNDLGSAPDGTGSGTSSADRVVGDIKALGVEAVASYDSVATPEGGQNIVDKAIGAFGRVDILINNAGILRDKTLLKMEPDLWKAVLEVHLNGTYNVTRPALANMRENAYGRIVFTTSAAGLYGNFGQTNYSAAKMGVIGLMNSVKLEALKYNIKVNTVAPVAATRLTEHIMSQERIEIARPEFVAPLVLYLCSEKLEDTGMIFNAGMGCFSRAALLTGGVVRIGERGEIPTPEAVAANMDRIKSLDGAVEFPNLRAAMASIDEAVGVASQ